MVPLFVCAALLLAPRAHGAATQAPSRATAARAVPVRDTARPALPPPPTIIVEAPSQASTVVLGIVGALLLAGQLFVMARQTTAMNRQTTLLDQQAQWRRDEAIGTFYRIAFGIADEFHTANVLPSTPIPANYETHPRQMLREVARLFAPLGNDLVYAATEMAVRVDQYFLAVAAYNEGPRGREGAERLMSVQELREQVGRNLDRANALIPSALRWKYADGKEYDFRVLCSLVGGLLEAIRIEASTPPGPAS
jgi:hypothetical protein